MESFITILQSVLDISVMLVALAILLGVIFIAILYVVDVTQTTQAIRRNYPVIGRLRYFFEHLGVFFRQYFFAMDREELPFNRAQRTWIAKAAKNLDGTLAFGSTRPLDKPGDVFFLNAGFPPTSKEVAAHTPNPIAYGEGFARIPYRTHSFFNISAMSYGALSEPAITALSLGAKDAGIWLNTGEGGLAPQHLSGGCDIIFQIGTAKYGVRDKHGNLDAERLKTVAEHDQVKMFEIKLSQGAKPGKGGILPAEKITDVIASTRGIPKDQDSISPNRHPDIRSSAELLDFIATVRDLTGKPAGIKFVMGQTDWLDDLLAEINARGAASAPDFITLDSADGGTGAAPQSLFDNVGLTVWESLPRLSAKLSAAGLRERIRVIASGKMVNPSGVAAALCLGADSVNSARGFMFALGCIQAMQCNQNTCPTGITTHDKKLQRGLNPAIKANRVANFARAIQQEVKLIALSAGVMDAHELGPKHAFVIDGNGRPKSLQPEQD
ncbi:MAG: FMN-binding glutamate synthase family protein [Luminiphilus sp.]|jgi:glutamate synthase domain-containing protein 2|nr:FMN-binding glutamate synthase family protein [Luminiphilus sp.]